MPRVSTSRTAARLIVATTPTASLVTTRGNCAKVWMLMQSMTSPPRTATALFQRELAVSRPRRRVPSSTTSSWSKLAPWMNSPAMAISSSESGSSTPTILPKCITSRGRARLAPGAWARCLPACKRISDCSRPSGAWAVSARSIRASNSCRNVAWSITLLLLGRLRPCRLVFTLRTCIGSGGLRGLRHLELSREQTNSRPWCWQTQLPT